MRRIILKENDLTAKQLPPDLDSELRMVMLNCPTYSSQFTPILLKGKWILKKVVAGKGYIALNSDYTYDKYETANPENEEGKLLPRPQSGNRWRPCDAAIKTTSLELSQDMQSTVNEFKKNNNLKTVEEIGGIGAYNQEQYQRYDIADLDKTGQTPKGKFFLYKEKGMGGKRVESPEQIRQLLGNTWTFDEIVGQQAYTLKQVMNTINMTPENRDRLYKGVATLKSLDPSDIGGIEKVLVWKNTAKVDLSSFDP